MLLRCKGFNWKQYFDGNFTQVHLHSLTDTTARINNKLNLCFMVNTGVIRDNETELQVLDDYDPKTFSAYLYYNEFV